MTTTGPALERLTLALVIARERGSTWPCADRDEWTSDDHETRAVAARACVSCAVSALCNEAADELGVVFGVWAGQDRSPPRPRAATKARQGESEKSDAPDPPRFLWSETAGTHGGHPDPSPSPESLALERSQN